jgi:hypothetical protein
MKTGNERLLGFYERLKSLFGHLGGFLNSCGATFLVTAELDYFLSAHVSAFTA